VRLGRLFFAGAVLLALAYFALRSPLPVADVRFLKHDFTAFGALVSVSAYLDEGMTRERGHEALVASEKFLNGYAETWAPSGKGLLGDINRQLAGGQTFSISGPTAALFVRAEEARVRSGGLFDARLGALVRLWGFDAPAPARTAPPDAAELRRLSGAVLRAPAFQEGATYGPAAEVQWDFSGIVKGLAVDEALARLKAAGIGNAVVNAGGSLRTAGKRGDAPWRIGLRHPRGKTPDDVIAYVLTDRDEALMTTGDYERYFEQGGVRYPAVIDPRTGTPAQGLQSVTVAHRDAAWADAASVALFVAGPARWREVARQMGIEEALVVTAEGQIEVTEAFNSRLKFLHDLTPRVVP
jgi:thiamine biosynthesis lipoprotein